MCQKQSITALSTAESEYVSLCEAAKKVVWNRRLFSDLGCLQTGPTVVYEDNRAAMALTASEPGQNPKVKHIAVRFHFTRQCIKDNELSVEFCPSVNIIADVFTKPCLVMRLSSSAIC